MWLTEIYLKNTDFKPIIRRWPGKLTLADLMVEVNKYTKGLAARGPWHVEAHYVDRTQSFESPGMN